LRPALRSAREQPPAGTRDDVIEKYTGQIAAADVYTESTTFWVTESIRPDLGYGSQVHP
jgi:hypothetical protein